MCLGTGKQNHQSDRIASVFVICLQIMILAINTKKL